VEGIKFIPGFTTSSFFTDAKGGGGLDRCDAGR